MKKIAIIMPKWIGDYIMALSAAEEKRRQHGVEIALITAPYLIELAHLLTDMEIIPLRTDEGLTAVQNGGFSDLYIIPHSISSALWGFSTGIRNRIGFKKEGRSPLLTERLKITNSKRTSHITTEYCTLLGIDSINISEVKGISLAVEKTDTIVLCPGAKYGPAKQWPHFSYLIDSFDDDQEIQILGSKDEAAYADLLIRENPSKRIVSFCGNGSLVEAAHRLAAAKAVISNDSGLMHLAAYVGAKVIGIFGSSSPSWTSPVGTANIVQWRAEHCSPCFKRECPYGHYHCLDKITVEQIRESISRLIS